jgi:hypothetical protein
MVVPLKINLWSDPPIVLNKKMHTDIFGQNTTHLLYVKILSAKFSRCMFQQPEEGALRRDNTRVGSGKRKEASFVQEYKPFNYNTYNNIE